MGYPSAGRANVAQSRRDREALELHRFLYGDRSAEQMHAAGGYLDEIHIHSNLVLHQHRVVFMLVPKCAATSIQCAVPRGKRKSEYRSMEYLLNVVPSYYRIAFVRDPYERLASCWKHKVRDQLHRTFPLFGITRDTPFDEFVRIVARTPDWKADKHFRSMTGHLVRRFAGTSLATPHHVLPHFIGRVEHMRYDWARLATILREDFGLYVRDLGHMNRTRGVVIYDDEDRALTVQRFKHDFELFEYNA